jgi:hypothetical protein
LCNKKRGGRGFALALGAGYKGVAQGMKGNKNVPKFSFCNFGMVTKTKFYMD